LLLLVALLQKTVAKNTHEDIIEEYLSVDVRGEMKKLKMSFPKDLKI
jgi:hypothetical protein